MSVTCPQCGHPSEVGDRFCSVCGTALVAVTPTAEFAENPLEMTGVLGVRSASEGDSAPLPIVDDRSVGDVAVGAAVLLALRGPSEGTRVLLLPEAGVVTVGRSPEAVMFLDDVTVSRRHAEFRPRDGHWEVVDVGSLNGSYVNRRRIDSAVLAGGDEVQLGKYRFAFLEGRGTEAHL